MLAARGSQQSDRWKDSIGPGRVSRARKTERQRRQRAATDSARESGEISERMDGIGLEGVKPIPEMSVGPEGRKEGRRKSEGWLS